MEKPGGPAVCLAIAALSVLQLTHGLSIDRVLKSLGIVNGAVVEGVGVAKDGNNGNAVDASRVCLWLLVDQQLACGTANLHPAGAVAPTEGLVRPVSGDLPGCGWLDAIESLGVGDALAAFLSVVAPHVGLELF